MTNAITALILAVCVILGGFAGHYLKSFLTGGDAADGSQAGAAPGKKSDADKNEPSGGHAKGKDSKKGYSPRDVFYYKFSREFIVPVLNDGKVESLVILNINIEADSAVSQQLFSLEPKLRDTIMTALIKLSGDGHTLQNLTNAENYETIRSMLLMELKDVVPTGIENVLILDLAKQDLQAR